MAEYLAALDAAAEPEPNCKVPKVISPSDPSSAWTARANKRAQFRYGLNCLIDIDNAVIVGKPLLGREKMTRNCRRKSPTKANMRSIPPKRLSSLTVAALRSP